MRSESTLPRPYPRALAPRPTGFGLIASLLMLLVLFAALAVALVPMTPPAIVPANIAETELSTERVMQQLGFIVHEPQDTRLPVHEALRPYLGNVRLPVMMTTPDAVHFTFGPRLAVSYPYDRVLPLTAITTGLLLVLFLVGLIRRRLIFGGVVLSALIYIAAILGALVLAGLVWLGVRAIATNAPHFVAGRDQTALFLAGLSALTVALISGVYVRLMWPERVANLFAGALLVMLGLLTLLSVVMPGASYLLTWPLLFSAPALAWLILRDPFAPTRWLGMLTFVVGAIVSALILVPALLLAAPLASRLETTSVAPLSVAPQLLVALMMGLLLPQLALVSGNVDVERRGFLRRWFAPTLAFGLAFVWLGWAMVSSGVSVSLPDLSIWVDWQAILSSSWRIK